MQPPIPARDMILVVLTDAPDSDGSYYVPRERTQDGLSDILDVSLGYISQEMKRLLRLGLVRMDKKNVKNRRRKVKVYMPTLAGEALAARLEEEFKDLCGHFPTPEDYKDGREDGILKALFGSDYRSICDGI